MKSDGKFDAMVDVILASHPVPDFAEWLEISPGVYCYEFTTDAKGNVRAQPVTAKGDSK